ncbi:glycerol-3-phosphate dehydrogenase [Rhodotorula diobovata]|uniref:Glycerol-3-phosphate dehydrogenase [NAD(+)] n=1 Tax=Rhodotorula diobovata TaxID=5288 RepID=A0A5C5FUT1_9BASI|nr:glycerol-3-phosphate dehydrogenase [Rhodotorula diobovata]
MSGQKVADQKWKIALVGSGNWGSAIARLVGKNVKERSDHFDTEVKMWCYEEDFEGRKLTEVINDKHENVKYLPGVDLGDNVVAEPDLAKAVEGANALIFVIPHQFIAKTCEQLEGKIAKGTHGISLIKGVDVKDGQIHIFSEVISERLGIECAALSGANIANEVAQDSFSETTIGCRDIDVAKKWQQLFETEKFRVAVSEDVVGVSLGGALKNVVAVAAGLIDGMKWGNNAKQGKLTDRSLDPARLGSQAAIMRIGLLEMKRFSLEFFPGTQPDTFVQESAGVADLITSCLGGRNHKVAAAFVTKGKSFEDLEKEMLNGQKLQGVETAKELYHFLETRGRQDAYPLFTFVYRVAYEGVKPDTITAHI